MQRLFAAVAVGLVALFAVAQPPARRPKAEKKAKPAPPSVKMAEDYLKPGPRPKKPPLPPSALPLRFVPGERVALVGNSTAERMGLFGHFETRLHLRHPELELVVRNFGYPADEVGVRQRSGDYTHLDDPLYAFNPDTFLCVFGFNESFKGPVGVEAFKANYEKFLDDFAAKYPRDDAKSPPRFILVSPIAFEQTGNPFLPNGKVENTNLKLYADAVKAVATKRKLAFVDVFTPTKQRFTSESKMRYTIDGCHVNEAGDREVASALAAAILGDDDKSRVDTSVYEAVRAAVVDKSWVHAQDYRMVNGWYVYGGRRTWDTETFPREYVKLRNMAAVRDRRVWDLAAGKPVADKPDDSQTGELLTPPTRFGVPQQQYSENAEGGPRIQPPADLIKGSTLAPGLDLKLFADESKFPELAKPVQINFDNKGRLWVACMPNYPQWKPGDPPANDRLLILEDTDGDGTADKCKVFYDKLHCPTGFEFFNGGVLVMSQPRILWLKDTDGDDKADQVVHLLDGWATDDTHHRGGWEWGPTGRLHLLEGIATSTTLETPWGPHRSQGAGGAYQIDPKTMRIRQFSLPGMANMWCYHFDQWGQGFVGDGTTQNQAWDTPLSGAQFSGRKGMTFLFEGKGERPNLGSERLISRALPDDLQGQFVYACVITMNGIPRFTLKDDGAGFKGQRILGPDGKPSDLLRSPDKHFRPADPQIGPDGALWFGDWANPLIGHMQYSQRDPNRDHVHGRIYRLVGKDKNLVKPVTQFGKSVPEILEQFREYEWRTRYRARRELSHERPASEVLPAVATWVKNLSLMVSTGHVSEARQREYDRLRCEALWIQSGHHAIDPDLLRSVLAAPTPEARAAAVHLLTDERDRIPGALGLLIQATNDAHPRVRVEAVRGLSFYPNTAAIDGLLTVAQQPMDYWTWYTVVAALGANESVWRQAFLTGSLAKDQPTVKALLTEVLANSKAGGAATPFLRILADAGISPDVRLKAMAELAKLKGNPSRGREVFVRNCTACHKVGNGEGQEYGPNLAGVMSRTKGEGKRKLVEHLIDPNAEVEAKYLSTKIETADGRTITGLVVAEDAASVTLFDGKDRKSIPKADIETRTALKQSSMPEGLAATMAPVEFVDLIEYLSTQRDTEQELKSARPQGAQWLHLPGNGPKVVLVSGDEEYRSEEALPQLAKILNQHHGFDCTVLFAIDPKTGTIDPYALDNLPGLEKLATADLVVLSVRMRQLKDADAKHLIDYAESGKPLVALRTSTHPLALKPDSAFAKYTWSSKVPGFEGGFGRTFLGETWVAHHGQHGKEGTRGIPVSGQESHPVLRGIGPGEVFGPTDVYTANPPANFTRLLLGQVTKTLSFDSPPVDGKKNNPMQPVAWVKGKTFVTTLGASQDLTYEGTRRLIVNGCLWALGRDVPTKANVGLVGDYKPTAFKFKGHKPGVKPEDLR